MPTEIRVTIEDFNENTYTDKINLAKTALQNLYLGHDVVFESDISAGDIADVRMEMLTYQYDVYSPTEYVNDAFPSATKTAFTYEHSVDEDGSYRTRVVFVTTE